MTGARSIAVRVVVLVTGLLSLPVTAVGQGSAEIPVVRFEAVYAGQSAAAPSYPIARPDDGEQGADLDQIRGGSLTFAQPLPVRDVLMLLFRGTPFSVVFDPAVNASFLGELSNLSLRQALEASITSQISADGFVQMNVSPTLAADADLGSAPAGGIVELDTLVRVRGGETVVIAGLLRDVTVIASAGGGSAVSKDRRTSRTELVLLLTPTVVSAGAAPAAGAQ